MIFTFIVFKSSFLRILKETNQISRYLEPLLPRIHQGYNKPSEANFLGFNSRNQTPISEINNVDEMRVYRNHRGLQSRLGVISH